MVSRNTVCLWFDGDAETAARRAFTAMMAMGRIDIATIEAARHS